MILGEKKRSQPIERRQVWEAFKAVRSNGGSAGVDGIEIAHIESNPRKYLYPVFVRMASGSYYPMPVRQELIPKYDGSKRALGIPTVRDRVAQTVIKEELEAIVDKQFSANSFGYRPGKGAHQAVEQCRINCMKFNWAIDLDIKGFFDTWFEENYPDCAFERYADDIIIHCRHFKQALSVLEAVNKRMNQCKLELKKQKTNIVYCKGNQKKHPPFKPKYVSFDFLGFTFKPRIVRSDKGRIYRGFTPAISKKAQKVIVEKFFAYKWLRETSKKYPAMFEHWKMGFSP